MKENSIRSKNTYFLSFEGIEGSGKSTQIELIKKHFEKNNFTVKLYREPGSTEFGEGLRAAILNSETKISPLAEAHLFASARAQLLFEKIIPDLNKENTVVLLDRFIDSSFCYQGIARNLGVETIEEIHSHAPLTMRPDLTFYLKIDYATSIERQQIRGNKKDYFEKEQSEFYRQLIAGFDFLSQKFSNRIKTIDANRNENEVFESIMEYLK